MTEQLSFEEVLNELMLAEAKPSYEALVRWQERYPDYRDRLADYFATWGVQAFHAEYSPPVKVDEDRIVQRTVNHAMDILRRQGRLIPKDSVETLLPFDQLVLTAVFQLRGAGDAADIAAKVREIAGRDVLLASVFGSLRKLEGRRLLESRYADAETEPEKEGTRYFMATMAGERALAHAKATASAVDDFLGDFA